MIIRKRNSSNSINCMTFVVPSYHLGILLYIKEKIRRHDTKKPLKQITGSRDMRISFSFITLNGPIMDFDNSEK